jgi:hypothetical protein
MVAGLVAALAATASSAPASSAPAAPKTARASQFVTPLSISLYCHIDGQTCEATASGGSGEYSFEWEWPIVEQYDADGVSGGDVVCYPYWGWRTISVTVTDSNYASRSASQSFYCPA